MSDRQRVEELTLKLLDGETSEEEIEELARLVTGDSEAADAHVSLVEQEATLRGSRRELDLTRSTLERIRNAIAERVESGVLETIRERAPPRKAKVDRTAGSLDPELPWLRARSLRWGAAAAALLLVAAGGTFSTIVTLRRAEPQEAFLYGQRNMTPGVATAFRLFVRNGLTGTPIDSAAVGWQLVSGTGQTVWSAEAQTDASGMAHVEPRVPADLAEGSYTLQVEAESDQGLSRISRTVKIQRSFKVLVTTDKPLFQPEQVIHIRTLSLGTEDLLPVEGREALIEVRDPRGNKVFKKKLTTSTFGIAAADFALADQVIPGEYVVSASVGDSRSERSVMVRRYRLPKFRIELATDRPYYPPGDTLECTIKATYTFGKPISGGTVHLVASKFIERLLPFATVDGTLDAEGRFRCEVPLAGAFVGQALKRGDALVSLEATVTDAAGHTQSKTLDRTVTARPIRVEVFPESGTLVQGVENTVYIVTAYPDGRPARTKLTLGATEEVIETSEVGIAKVKIRPVKPRLQLTVVAEDAEGTRVEVSRALRIDKRSDAFLLRTDRAIYRTGDTMEILVLSPARSGLIFLDVVKDRRTVLTRSIDVRDGKGELLLDLAQDLFGTLELHAYRIRRDGVIVGDAKVVQVNRSDDLRIRARLDRETYRPAERAVLDLVVERRDGQPVPAALGLAGVDEAVFALDEMRPGLERVYFLLQEELLKPRYEIHATAPFLPVQAVQERPPEEPALEEASVVLFSASSPGAAPSRNRSVAYTEKKRRLDQEKARLLAGPKMAGLLVPFVLLLLALLPLLVYSVWRVFRRDPIQDADAKALGDLNRSVNWIAGSWLVGLYVPLGVLMLSISENPAVLVVLALGCLVVLTFWTFHFRRNPASRCTPLLRKSISLLPVAYVVGAVALGCLAFAEGVRPRTTLHDVLPAAAICVVGLLLLTFGATLAAGKSVVRRISTPRWFGYSLGCTFLATVGVSLLVLFSMSLLTAGRSAGIGMWPTDSEAAMPTAERRGPPKGEKGGEEVETSPRVRRFFPETLLWVPELITDASGHGRVEIPLADSITTWRVAVSGVSGAGELGSAVVPLRVFQDFFVDVDFPAALTQHDRVGVPVAVYNYLDRPQAVRLEVEPQPWFRFVGTPNRTVDVAPHEVTSVRFLIEALEPGRQALTVRARGGEVADAVRRTVIVEPDGHPVIQTVNGRLGEKVTHEFVVPPEAIDGASDLHVKIYPSSFSQVVEGLENIFRMPHGCFEQTSSTTYPNVLALSYLRETGKTIPEIEMKALQYIQLGYQRLLSFEVAGGGFEWFGHAPAHTVLSAYGLMEFADMAKVYEVDPRVIERTRNWLFSRQRQDGSWSGDRRPGRAARAGRSEDSVLRTTSYVAWAIAESLDGASNRRLSRALEYVSHHSSDSNDPYTLALAANALAAGGHQGAAGLLQRLEALKTTSEELVYWSSRGVGNFHSRGRALDVETTALAAHVFLENRTQPETIGKALAWLVAAKDPNGTWRSTQATVLALRALLAGTGPAGSTESETHVTIAANGQLGKEILITPDTSDVLRLVSLKEFMREGRNSVALEVAGESDLTFQLVATHYVPWGRTEVEPERELDLDLAYDATELETNDILICRATLLLRREGHAGMTIIDLGIPPGFELLTDAFEALKEERRIERYSVTGRQVILYLPELEGGAPFRFEYRMRAKYPVKVQTPPSAAYPYYEPDVRDRTSPVELTVR